VVLKLTVLHAFCAGMTNGSGVKMRFHKALKRLSSFVFRHISEMRTSTGIMSASHSESSLADLIVEANDGLETILTDAFRRSPGEIMTISEGLAHSASVKRIR
jgi:hypothetical protein